MRRRAVLALLGAACGVGLLFGTWFAAFHVGFLKRADERILLGFAGLHRPRVDSVAVRIASLCSPHPFVYFALVPIAIAALRRRPRSAIAVATILLGSNVTTQLLKPLLAEPRTTSAVADKVLVGAASWPSGHATAAMALGLCGVVAAPRRWRPLAAALGGGFAVAVAYAVLVLAWHFPSDVIGGFLVAATWALGVLAALAALERRRPSRAAAESAAGMVPALAPLAVAAAAGAAAVAVAAARPEAARAFALAHPTFVVGAAAIAGAAAALAAVLARAAR
jgi:membrane-associated phospholipid phosphatase